MYQKKVWPGKNIRRTAECGFRAVSGVFSALEKLAIFTSPFSSRRRRRAPRVGGDEEEKVPVFIKRRNGGWLMAKRGSQPFCTL